MGKVFQIVDGFCYYDATRLHDSVGSIPPGIYPPSLQFTDAPDYVREGWGFDETQEGDPRFIEPIPPEGWGYDRETGTFYEIEK